MLTTEITGALLGGVFAAILSQLVYWPWTYWVMAVVLFVYCGTSFLILPLDHLDPTEGSKPIFDFAGTLTGVTGLILLNFAWNQDAVVGWHVPYTYALMIVGILFFAVFCYIEVKYRQKSARAHKGSLQRSRLRNSPSLLADGPRSASRFIISSN